MAPGSTTWSATARSSFFPATRTTSALHPQEFLQNALAAIHDALGVVHAGVGHVRPDPGRFALIGHSAGGNLAAQIAAIAADPQADLPIPQAVVIVMPGEIVPTPEPNLSSISASTLMIVMVGEEDVLVGDLRGRQIFAAVDRDSPVEKTVCAVSIGSTRLPAPDRRAHSAERRSFPA